MRSSYPILFQWLTIITCFSGSVALFVFFPGCGTPNYWSEAKAGQKKILVTFPPLYSIAHAVAGEDAYVLCMLTTSGPHSYQGAPTDLFMVNKADILFYNGLTLDDDFVDKMTRNHRNPALVTINLGRTIRGANPKLILKGDGKEHDHGDGVKHSHGDHDPHLWLGPRQAVAMTEIMRDRLIDLDPDNKKRYEERADAFIKRLVKLHEDGKDAFKDQQNKKLITMHEAFAYFAHAFGLEITASIQLAPGMDPDPIKIKELVTLCRSANGPRVIAIEPQYSSAQADLIQKTLKKEDIDVKVVTLDPLETAAVARGSKFNPDPEHYLAKMRANIETLSGKKLP